MLCKLIIEQKKAVFMYAAPFLIVPMFSHLTATPR